MAGARVAAPGAASTAAIARRLVVSPVTVRTHVNNILRKVRAPSREALLKDFEGRE